METLVHWIVNFVDTTGYVGIFVMTFLESTFLPIPSEITMVPAGYLVHQGKMEFLPVFLSSTIGTVGGAYLNYYIARRFGRPLIVRFQKYFFLNAKKLAKLDIFFDKHGEISTFTGRLLPGIRHFISMPAGLAGMRLDKFLIYTTLGGALWMMILIGVGYFIGDNEAMIRQALNKIVGVIVIGAVLVIALYWYIMKRKGVVNND